MREVAAVAMTVNAFKTRALFDGKRPATGAADTPSRADVPEPEPGSS